MVGEALAQAADASSSKLAFANALCMLCGLCCDGVLFGSILVEPEERERLGRLGLRVVDQDGALQMSQRCSALRGTLCSIYENRPNACTQYECSQRKSLLAGLTSEGEALANVARMRALLAMIRRAFDLNDDTVAIWEAIVALKEPTPFEPGSPEAHKYESGIAAVTELLALGRAAFEPAFAGGGARNAE